jgi:hypothetical protein
MHTEAKPIARKLVGLLAIAASVLLAGCDLSIKNLTPAALPENPSQVYTLTLRAAPRSAAIIRDSIRPTVVVDGQAFPMVPSNSGRDIFEFDYRLPPGQTGARYYFIIPYQISTDSGPLQREAFTALTDLQLANRYGLSLEANRAPVGARVAVLGRGFTPNDVVLVGGQSARTVFESANSLAFFVPPIAAGRAYAVTVAGSSGSELSAGTLRVDGGTLRVTPSSLSLASGDRRMLVFTISSEAPPGGIALEVTTDAAASVIMPDAVVPAGARSVSVPVEGGRPGSGTIWIELPGYGEVTVPITVTGR